MSCCGHTFDFILYHSANYIFLVLSLHIIHLESFENGILLKQVKYCIIHEQTSSAEVTLYFYFRIVFRDSKGYRESMLVSFDIKFTVKILKFGTPQTIAIIVLKIEKFDVTLH